MNDFVAYEPAAHGVPSGRAVGIRSAAEADAHGLATVMSARGGELEGHLTTARRRIAQLPVLLIAERDGRAVGWCGAQRCRIDTDRAQEWMVAGLTVLPKHRRQGIAGRLLQGVLMSLGRDVPGEPLFSVVNALNPASIDLHLGAGFEEVDRGATFAGISFTGGEGVLLRSG